MSRWPGTICASAALFLSLLAGCAHRPPPLYYWGSYQVQVYDYFKGEKDPQAGIQALEADRERARSRGSALPPGFQAHLAVLYGKTGRLELMAENLAAEKRQFPESSVFMDFLLRKFQPPIADEAPQ